MKRFGIWFVVLTILCGGACCYAQGVKEISTAGITVTYPNGMEAQANKVMAMAQSTIKPSIETHRQTIALLSDVGAMAQDIAQALGAEERQDNARSRLQMFKSKSEGLVGAFSDIKLVRKADAVATEGIDAGVIQVRYNKEKDEFNMVLAEEEINPDKIKRSYFPVLINADGSIRAEDKLTQISMDFLGSGDPMAIAPVQDTISYLIAVPLRLYNPFSRWFNEGVSGFLTRQIVAKYGSKQLNNVSSTLFSVSSIAKEQKDKVNLISWPQSPYLNRDPASFDSKMEVARIQYSVEAISGLLAKSGPQALAKIMSGLNYTGNPDTELICEAIQKATNTDFKPILMSYVPQNIRDGIASEEAPRLVEKASKLAGEKKWADAASALRLALDMNPQDVNARLNLAWIERELGDLRDSELQVFLTAGLLKQQKHSFSLFEGTIEGMYVSGRLAILMGNLEAAKQFLEPVLQLKPDHADAKRAMDDIRKIESATKG